MNDWNQTGTPPPAAPSQPVPPEGIPASAAQPKPGSAAAPPQTAASNALSAGAAPPAQPAAGGMPPAGAQPDLHSARRNFSRIGLGYFLIVLIWYAVAIPMTMIVAHHAPQTAISGWFQEVISTVPLYLVAVPFGMLLFWKVPAEAPQQQKLPFGKLVACFFLSYFIMQAGNLLGSLLVLPLEWLRGGAINNPVEQLLSGSNLWIMAVGIVLVAPVGEELLMRKVLLDRARRYGEIPAMLLSGVLFGLFHANLSQFFYAFAIGIFFAYIYLRTGRVQYTIVLHMLLNFLGGILPTMLLQGAGDLTELSDALLNGAGDAQAAMNLALDVLARVTPFLVYGLCSLGFFITGLVFFCSRFKRRRFLPAAEELPKKKRFSTIYLNVGMILFFVLSLILIVISLLS